MACCVPATAVTTAVSPPAIEIDAAEVADVMMFYLFEFGGEFPFSSFFSELLAKEDTLCLFCLLQLTRSGDSYTDLARIN